MIKDYKYFTILKMSLFNNLKTNSYTELNVRLIILEKLFKNFLKDNNSTIEEIKLIFDELCSNEQLETCLPTFPNTQNTYSDGKVNFNLGNNVFFQ
jgi:hypothetical protein